MLSNMMSAETLRPLSEAELSVVYGGEKYDLGGGVTLYTAAKGYTLESFDSAGGLHAVTFYYKC